MTNQEILLSKILRDAGYSVTKQRQIVFEILNDSEPLSMSEIIIRAKGQLDRASIYRIISLFDHLGITQRLNIGWKYKIELTDKFAEHHHHLTCLKCHSVTPINQQKLESFIDLIASQQSFKPIEHQLEIQGLCQNCQGIRVGSQQVR